ncbi:MAG: PKD domain-containing protein [Bacteroidia bacterium]
MKKQYITIAALALLTVVVGCKRKLPVACITAAKTEALVNEELSFASCATDAASVNWSFGDGSNAEGESAAHKYTKAGTYALGMRVLSKKNKASDNITVIVTVKDAPVAVAKSRYLTKIVLKAFPQDNAGTKWDAGVGGFGSSDADIFINFGADSTILFHSDFVTNATQAILPKTYNIGAFNFKLEDKNYFIDLLDDDGSGTSNLTSARIRTLVANLGTAVATNGKITVTDTNCSVDVYFEER